MQTNGQTERKKRENVDKQYVAWCAKKTKRFVVQNRKEKRTHHTTSTIANLKTEKTEKKLQNQTPLNFTYVRVLYVSSTQTIAQNRTKCYFIFTQSIISLRYVQTKLKSTTKSDGVYEIQLFSAFYERMWTVWL